MKPLMALLLVGIMQLSAPVAEAQHAGEAQQHAEAGTEEHESPLAVVFRWANFILLVGLLGYLLKKPALDFFEGRRQEISSGLSRAQEAKENAEARMSEIEQRLARLSTEIGTLRAEAEKESSVEREKILSEAKREVDRIVEQSRQEIDRVTRSVERQVKETIADLVIDSAGRTLQTEMTQDDHKRVVVRFIKNL